jgi:hypothetical protein
MGPLLHRRLTAAEGTFRYAAARRRADRSDWKRMKARISASCCFRHRRLLNQDLSLDMRITLPTARPLTSRGG